MGSATDNTDNTNKLDSFTVVKRAYIFEPCEESKKALRELCTYHSLTPCNISEDEMLDLLSNPQDVCKDMYLFLLGPTESELGIETADMATRLLGSRRDLLIFARCSEENRSSLKSHSPLKTASNFITYEIDNLTQVEQAFKEQSSINIPSDLIKEVYHLTEEALSNQFNGIEIAANQPYMILDQMVKGALMTVASVNGRWCRGWIIIDCAEDDLFTLVSNDKTPLDTDENPHEAAQIIITELANLVIGSFKNNLFTEDDYSLVARDVQLPLMINCVTNTLQLPTAIPQICFKYYLKDMDNLFPPCSINIKLIFNVLFDAEGFKTAYEKILKTRKEDGQPQPGSIKFFE